MPAFVSTLCICIVFVPMFFLTGVARYLFVPMAEAVVFAMLASYVLSRTLVPTMAKYLLHGARARRRRRAPSAATRSCASSARSTRGSCGMRDGYRALLERCVGAPRGSSPRVFLGACLASLVPRALGRRGLLPGGGRRPVQAAPARADRHAHRGDGALSPTTSSGAMRETHPGRASSAASSTTSACPTAASTCRTARRRRSARPTPTSWCRSARDHRPTAEYIHDLRMSLPQRFPGVTFSFVPADIVTQILNFGLPAPIDIQVVGRKSRGQPAVRGRRCSTNCARCPASSTCACSRRSTSRSCTSTWTARAPPQLGFTQRDVANNLLISLSGSGQTTPTFWLNPRPACSYAVATQTPQYRWIRCRISATFR